MGSSSTHKITAALDGVVTRRAPLPSCSFFRRAAEPFSQPLDSVLHLYTGGLSTSLHWPIKLSVLGVIDLQLLGEFANLWRCNLGHGENHLRTAGLMFGGS